MKFEEKLKKQQYDMLWQEYCGFLDLDIDSYMNIQYRLMSEQISLWSECELGKKMLRGKHPNTIEEFRQMVPLTTYGDYADILLQKKGEMLPDYPIIWIQTTQPSSAMRMNRVVLSLVQRMIFIIPRVTESL